MEYILTNNILDGITKQFEFWRMTKWIDRSLTRQQIL